MTNKEIKQNNKITKSVKYGQSFWRVESHIAKHNVKACAECLRNEEHSRDEWFHRVEEWFVLQKNKYWNGLETFDICPVNFKIKENKDASWRVKIERNANDIGKEIFNTKKEAISHFNSRFDKKQRFIFKKLEKFYEKK